jgi:hypothetical protein
VAVCLLNVFEPFLGPTSEAFVVFKSVRMPDIHEILVCLLDYLRCGMSRYSEQGIVVPALIAVASKYPPAEPEALGVAAPSKGADRDPKSKPPVPGSIC